MFYFIACLNQNKLLIFAFSDIIDISRMDTSFVI